MYMMALNVVHLNFVLHKMLFLCILGPVWLCGNTFIGHRVFLYKGSYISSFNIQHSSWDSSGSLLDFSIEHPCSMDGYGGCTGKEIPIWKFRLFRFDYILFFMTLGNTNNLCLKLVTIFSVKAWRLFREWYT